MVPKEMRPFFLVILALLISSCVQIPETSAIVSNTPTVGRQVQTSIPVNPSPSALLLLPTTTVIPGSPTPPPFPLVQLPGADQVVFTTPNTEPWSGKEGDPRPDWKGWGAETFTVAPDDKFWVADTAVYPNRLLHYSPQGKLLTSGMNGYHKLINASGEISTRPLDALTYYGHTYQEGSYDQTTGQLPIFVDGIPFETSPDFVIEAEPFLGFNPDGSFALAGYVQDDQYPVDQQVRYYNTSGELLGTARQRPQTFYKDWNHHLAFGLDGSIYQMLSNPDHSVEILRLGFTGSLSPRAAIPSVTPTPLSPLHPSESSATDEDQARNALLAFFYHLSAGNYEGAVAHFGGQLPEYLRPQSPDETITEYWEYICTFLRCLPVAEVTAVEQVSVSEYLFYIVFMQLDGTRFEIGACCGDDPAAIPPAWQFAYPVQKNDSEWKAMRAPLITP